MLSPPQEELPALRKGTRGGARHDSAGMNRMPTFSFHWTDARFLGILEADLMPPPLVFGGDCRLTWQSSSAIPSLPDLPYRVHEVRLVGLAGDGIEEAGVGETGGASTAAGGSVEPMAGAGGDGVGGAKKAGDGAGGAAQGHEHLQPVEAATARPNSKATRRQCIQTSSRFGKTGRPPWTPLPGQTRMQGRRLRVPKSAVR